MKRALIAPFASIIQKVPEQDSASKFADRCTYRPNLKRIFSFGHLVYRRLYQTTTFTGVYDAWPLLT